MPKLRSPPFETAIIPRYQRRETSGEEALVEMYLAGVSVRRVEDITEALWGTKVSPSTVRELNQKIAGQIQQWRQRPIEGVHAYVYLDGIWLKRSWGGEVKNVSILVAIGVNAEGFRKVLGVAEGTKEDKASWQGLMRYLKERGLKGVQLVIGNRCLGLVESLRGSSIRRRRISAARCIFTAMYGPLVPSGKVKTVAAMLKAIHASENPAAAQEKARQVAAKLREMKLPAAASLIEGSIHETLSYYAFPREHHRSIRTNNPLERIMKEIRRRTREVGTFRTGTAR